jgi:hypothetical protein
MMDLVGEALKGSDRVSRVQSMPRKPTNPGRMMLGLNPLR